MTNYEQPEYVDKRLRYFDGQFLHEQDFIDEQLYHIDRQRRQARMFLSPGVAQGLDVRRGKALGTLEVERGTAIDPAGRLIVLKERAVVPVALRDSRGAMLYILWQQGEDDSAGSGGSAGKTRWHEKPGFAIAEPGKAPERADAVPLAGFNVDADGAISLNPAGRQMAGVRTQGPLSVAGEAVFHGNVKWGNSASVLSPDQGGSIELGNSFQDGARPYIDFHYGAGKAQDYNIRIQNVADRQLAILGGALGIGTAGPHARLHVHGGRLRVSESDGEHGSAVIELHDGSRPQPNVIFAEGGTGALHLRTDSAAHHVLLQTGGQQQGNVGINAWQLHGRVTIEDQAVPLSFRETNQPVEQGGWWRMPLDGGALRFDVNTGAPGQEFNENFRTVFFMGSDGRVGIGTGYPAVSGLHIGKDAGDGQARIQLDNKNEMLGQINRWNNRLEILSSDALHLAVGNIGDTKVAVTPDGRVGIGTTGPGTQLDVQGGDIRTSGSLFWSNGTSLLSADQGGSIELGDSSQQGARPYIDFHYGVGAAQDYNIRIQNVADRQLAILGGALSIGTEQPHARLHVHGGRMRVSESDEGSGSGVLELASAARTNYVFTNGGTGNLHLNTDSPAHHVLLQTGGAQGSVGIGTEQPAVPGLHIGKGVEGGQARIQLDNTNGAWAQLNRWSDRFEILASDSLRLAIGNAGDTKMMIAQDGKVGIGAAVPEARLHVHGGRLRVSESDGEHGSAVIELHDGSRPQPNVIFAEGGTGALHLRTNSAAHHVLLQTGGQQQGNVGINAWQLHGRVTIEDQSVPLSFRETNHPVDQGGWWRMPLDGGALRFDVNTGAPGNEFGEFRTVLLMGSDGKVGIGTGSPAVSGLHIGKGVGDGQARIQLDNKNEMLGQINRWNNRLEILSSDALHLAVGNVGDTKVTIAPNGAVGIGTTDPRASLHVRGNDAVLNLEGRDHAYIAYFPDGWSGGRKAWLGFGNVDENNLTIGNEIPEAHIVLATNGGNVGIGMPKPEAKLDVQGGSLRVTSNPSQMTFADEGGVTVLRVGHSESKGLSVINLNNATQHWQLRTDGGAEHKFKLYDATHGVDVLTVDPKGKMSIGHGALINGVAIGTAVAGQNIPHPYESITVAGHQMNLRLHSPGVITLQPERSVGIGTLGPDSSYKLDVNGNGHFSSNLTVDGNLTCNSISGPRPKFFKIDHPTRHGYKLLHACIEGPEAGVYYRGVARLIDGRACVHLPEYFEKLTRQDNRTVQLTPMGESPFLLSYTEIVDGTFAVYGTAPEGVFAWEVKAERADIDQIDVEVQD